MSDTVRAEPLREEEVLEAFRATRGTVRAVRSCVIEEELERQWGRAMTAAEYIQLHEMLRRLIAAGRMLKLSQGYRLVVAA